MDLHIPILFPVYLVKKYTIICNCIARYDMIRLRPQNRNNKNVGVCRPIAYVMPVSEKKAKTPPLGGLQLPSSNILYDSYIL